MTVGDVVWSSGLRGIVAAETPPHPHDGTGRLQLYVEWQLPGTELLISPDALPPAGGA